MGTESTIETVAELPPNWPSGLQYTHLLRWDDVSEEIRIHYEDEVDVLSVYVDVVEEAPAEGTEESSGRRLVIPKQSLQCGAWLCEIVGSIIDSTQLKRLRRYEGDEIGLLNGVFLHQRQGKRYFIEPSSHEFSLLRQLEANDDRDQANLKVRRIVLEGRTRAYLEILKNIDVNEELVIDYDSDEEAFVDTSDLPFSQAEVNVEDIPNISNTFNLSPEEAQFFDHPQTLREMYQIQKVMQEQHPCYGQNGLFSLKRIHSGQYLGEYTGDVIIHDPDATEGKERIYHSRYLMDFSNPYSAEEIQLKESWVDADLSGNELRFINDASGTGNQSNVHFKRAWLGGKMHVICQATAPVEIGDELLVEYGDRYWENIHVDGVGEEMQEEQKEEEQ